VDRILGDVRDRVAEGAKEITLLGQTVNSYHRDAQRGRDTDFADLLQAVGAVDGVERIRFMSPHPHYMTPRVIEAMAEQPAVCESLHLPVQSGSNPVLKRMLRNYTREQYLDLVGDLRRAMPEMTIGTDLIVGFPGETEEDFRRTLSLIGEARFDWGYIFKYSPRAGTPAAAWEPHPTALVEDRHAECLAAIDRMAAGKRQRMPGRVEEVLVEEDGVGRTRTNYRVRVEGPAAIGETVRVRIAGAAHATLEGKPEGTIGSQAVS
jgi:tRNA-2-methylthio-N6-dimethylallyladenosine synthase